MGGIILIGVSDPDQFTFSQQLIDHWEKQGHEVRKSLYHEEKFVNECDVVFYDFASAAVGELGKEKQKPKAKIIVRAIDVENYMNYCQRFNFDYIDHYIFLNESQKKMVMDHPDFHMPEEKIHIIQMGIDTKKFNLKHQFAEKPRKITFIGRLWIGKNVLGAIDVADLWYYMDKKVELHILGDNRYDPRWWRKLCEYRISQTDMPIYFEHNVDDVNEYLEDKDLLIQPSFKEAFSFVTAEALSKGIPALVHDWYGSHDVWPEDLIYRYPHEALNVYDRMDRNPRRLRSIVTEKYDQERMFREIDALL